MVGWLAVVNVAAALLLHVQYESITIKMSNKSLSEWNGHNISSDDGDEDDDAEGCDTIKRQSCIAYNKWNAILMSNKNHEQILWALRRGGCVLVCVCVCLRASFVKRFIIRSIIISRLNGSLNNLIASFYFGNESSPWRVWRACAARNTHETIFHIIELLL